MPQSPQSEDASPDRFRFIIEQLCSDLQEISDGLQAGALAYGTAIQAAQVQVEWIRGELRKLSAASDGL